MIHAFKPNIRATAALALTLLISSPALGQIGQSDWQTAPVSKSHTSKPAKVGKPSQPPAQWRQADQSDATTSGLSDWNTGGATPDASGQSAWQTPSTGAAPQQTQTGTSDWIQPGGSNQSAAGKSGWIQPGSAGGTTGQSGWVQPNSTGGGTGQSGWIQPGTASGGGTSQSGWTQPATSSGGGSMSDWQNPGGGAPAGQSNWQTPAASSGAGLSNWQNGGATQDAVGATGQSNWQQAPLLGEVMQQEQTQGQMPPAGIGLAPGYTVPQNQMGAMGGTTGGAMVTPTDMTGLSQGTAAGNPAAALGTLMGGANNPQAQALQTLAPAVMNFLMNVMPPPGSGGGFGGFNRPGAGLAGGLGGGGYTTGRGVGSNTANRIIRNTTNQATSKINSSISRMINQIGR